MPTRPTSGARAFLLLGAAALLLPACASPFPDKHDKDLRRAVRLSAERELAESSLWPDLQRTVREDRIDQLHIDPKILEELEKLAGPNSYAPRDLPLGPDLYGRPQQVVRVTLERSVTGAVQHNLNVEFARLAPAISQQQFIAADAAFDWVFFANGTYSSNDQPRIDSTSSGIFTGVNSNISEVTNITLGLRKPLIAGGQLSLQTEFMNTLNKTEGLSNSPNPARESNFVIQLDQPLLRNFGSDVALAQVRLARNAELDSIAQLKSTLLQNVNETERAYWDLVRSEWDLKILLRFLEEGEKVVEVLRKRAFDVKPATLSNAVAAVESRRADVLRAARVLREASDALKVLVNDPEFPIGSEVMLLPADGPIDQALEFSLLDSVNEAIANRPEVKRALISLDNTGIRIGVADNNRLPKLDMKGLVRFNGQGSRIGSPYQQLFDADFVDYQIGLVCEIPIGNRAPEALFRQRRLEQMQAVNAYRSTIQGIVRDLKTSLRDIIVNYRLISQTRTLRIAASEDLRTLLVEERLLQGLTPEFLNLKLQRQQALASAEQQEITALVDYNTSLSRFYTSTGTALARNRIAFDVPNATTDKRTNDLFPDFPLEPKRPSSDTIRGQ